MEQINLSIEETKRRARVVSNQIPAHSKIWGVPRGGTYAALLVAACDPTLEIVETSNEANVIIDDIVDSGATRQMYTQDFHALVNKLNRDSCFQGKWVSFFWERSQKEDGPQDNVRRILEYIGEDPHREGLKETPDRVVRSYSEIFGGYGQDPGSVLKTFEDDTCDEMVILRDIEFYSVCEHHMQPFFGRAHISYIPNGRVVGISKLARLLEVFSRRLQIQERLCEQITGALMENLKPKGAACVLEAQHFCMVCRGVGKQNSKMITSSLKGAFLEPAVRAEFLSMIRG